MRRTCNNYKNPLHSNHTSVLFHSVNKLPTFNHHKLLHYFFPLYFIFLSFLILVSQFYSNCVQGFSILPFYLIWFLLNCISFVRSAFESLLWLLMFVVLAVIVTCFSRLHKSMIFFLHSSFYHSQILIYCPITISLYTAFFTSSLHNDKMCVCVCVCVCVWECFRGRRWQRQQKFRISPTG